MTSPQGPTAPAPKDAGAPSGPVAQDGPPRPDSEPGPEGEQGLDREPRPEREDRPRGAAGSGDADSSTTVLPSSSVSGPRRTPPPRPETRPGAVRTSRPTDTRSAGATRRARLALQRIDPWSVFLYSLIASLFLGIALVVAVAVLYAVLGRLGVLETVNELFLELTSGDASSTPLFTAGRFVGGATVLAAVNVVLLTLLSTLSALLYNLVASFTGGIELTLGERDS